MPPTITRYASRRMTARGHGYPIVRKPRDRRRHVDHRVRSAFAWLAGIAFENPLFCVQHPARYNLALNPRLLLLDRLPRYML